MEYRRDLVIEGGYVPTQWEYASVKPPTPPELVALLDCALALRRLEAWLLAQHERSIEVEHDEPGRLYAHCFGSRGGIGTDLLSALTAALDVAEAKHARPD
jgi:hypothetical protein